MKPETTRGLLDSFYANKMDAIAETVKTMIDKPFLFEYEESIHTKLMDMNEDQLLELINIILHHKQGKSDSMYLSMRSYDNVRNALYRLFDFYIETHPMRNPFSTLKLKRENVRKYLAANKKVFSMDDVKDLIASMVFDYGPEQAGYLEMLLLLFYSGFKNYQEIVDITETSILWKSKSIRLQGRTIHLTDRCFDLFQKYYYSDYVQGKYKLLYITKWKQCVFPFMVQASLRDKMVEYEEKDVKTLLVQQYSYYILKPYKTKISYHTMFYLGLYDRLVQKYGLEMANAIIENKDRKYTVYRDQFREENQLTSQTAVQTMDALLPFMRSV